MPTTPQTVRSSRRVSDSATDSMIDQSIESTLSDGARVSTSTSSAASAASAPASRDRSSNPARHRAERSSVDRPDVDDDIVLEVDLDDDDDAFGPSVTGFVPTSATSRTSVDAADLPELWERYQRDQDPDALEQLVDYYMATHVRRLAERLHARLPNQVDLDDLIQEGYIGLLKAIDRFDVSRRIKFETFSSQRVVGAMRDYLRSIDTVPRLVRQRERKLQAMIEEFHKDHGRGPSDDELQQMLDLPEGRFQKVMLHGRAHTMIQFNSVRADGDGDDETDPMRAFEDTRSAFGGSPQVRGEHEDLRKWLTNGFSRRDRLIVILYYYERMTMKEVGHVLGISESRVSQRLDAILQSLRARLCDTGAEQEFYFRD